MALKAKQLSAPVGADLLPQLMREAALPLEESERIPIDKIVPASREWNFYAPLPDDKMLELIESIRENGLLHPIVVWKRKDAPTMVLSGHNRLEAYKKLYQATGGRAVCRHSVHGENRPHARTGAGNCGGQQLGAAHAYPVGKSAFHSAKICFGRAKSARGKRQ